MHLKCFFESIIEAIKWRRIENVVRFFRGYKGHEESLTLLEEWTGSEDLGKLIWLIGEDNLEIVFKAQQALLGQKTATIKNALRVRRTTSSNSDRASILSCLFRLLSQFNKNSKFNDGRRIILWIDELESLIYYTSKQYRPFTQFLRELYDNTSSNFTLFLNFSFADPTDAQNIEIVLGQALIDRVSHNIIFDEADMAESKQYILELLKAFRTTEFKDNKFFPFSEKSIQYLFDRAYSITEKPRTPRTLNKWCLKTIEEAFSKRILYDKLIEIELINLLDFSSD